MEVLILSSPLVWTRLFFQPLVGILRVLRSDISFGTSDLVVRIASSTPEIGLVEKGIMTVSHHREKLLEWLECLTSAVPAALAVQRVNLEILHARTLTVSVPFVPRASHTSPWVDAALQLPSIGSSVRRK